MDLNKIVGDLFRDYGLQLKDIMNMSIGDLFVVHEELTKQSEMHDPFEDIYNTIADMQEQFTQLQAINKSQQYINNMLIQMVNDISG